LLLLYIADVRTYTVVLYAAVDNYNYLLNGEAVSSVEKFIANKENTYEEYIEVCTVCAVVRN